MDLSNRRAYLSFHTFRSVLVLAFLMPTVALFARHSPSTLVAIAAFLLILSRYFGEDWDGYIQRLKAMSRSNWFILLVAVAFFACISTFWSSAGFKGLTGVLQTTSSIAMCILIIASLTKSDLQQFAKPMLAGIVFCAALLVFDALNQHSLRLLLIPQARVFDTNRAALLVALATPALLAMVLHKGRMPITASFIFTLCIIAVEMSYSESAKLAVIVSIIAFFVLYYFGKWAWRLTLAVTVLLFIAAPVIFGSIHDVMPHFVFQNTPYITVEIRTNIWSTYAQLTGLKPFLGFGAGASETLASLPEVQAKVGVDNQFLKNIHPHSAPLQIWIELGLIGASLAMCAFVAATQQLDDLERQPRALIGSFIIAVLAVSAVSHGLWQAWWPSVIGYAALMLFSCFARERGKDRRIHHRSLTDDKH